MELPNRRHSSVTLADGIKLSFGSNKSGNAMAWQDNCLLIESLAGTTDGAYVSLSHDGYYIYHITLKDHNGNLITEAWKTEKSYTYRANAIRLKTIVVEYANYIPFTDAVKVAGCGRFSSSTNISKNYALRWAQYTVRFHKNDGGNPEATTDQSFTYTEQKALTTNAFSREDYVLSGWSTTADGEVAYSDVQSVQNLTATDGAVFHLYAQWRHEGGSCGDNAHWSYDDNGTLSITGTGDINGFGKDNQPWKQYKNDITTLYIGDGITYICCYAFYNCTNLTTINGGNDLTDIVYTAFINTQWWNNRKDNNVVNYIGRMVYKAGSGITGDVTIADGTIG